MNIDSLAAVDSTSFLGLFIETNLSWDSHVEHVVSKMTYGLFVLRQMGKML